jgi:acyl carrier protein
MTNDEIYAALTEIFSEVFFRDDLELRPDLTSHDVDGWDSHKQVEIVLATEERFGIQLKTREINRLDNVSDLVALIAQKTA